MPTSTVQWKSWLAGWFAVAILALLVSGQGKGATDGINTDLERSSLSDRTQSVATPDRSAAPPHLLSMAQQTLDSVGIVPPPVWNALSVSVTSVAPADNALDVPVSTNVTVTFSSEIDPATVTSGSFRLLDPSLTPVPAQVSLAPLGLQATLDPIAALGFSQLYTVELTSAIQGAGPLGGPLTPFGSQFSTTVAEPPAEQLPDVAEQAAPPANATQAKIGSALSAAGDLNDDGYDDFLTGAPGLELGSLVEVGAALVYLGSATPGELVQPDIIFEGIEAHDRTGVAVAGDFDFNGDGRPDILIGAEQVNRSGADDPVAGCDDGAACDGGKVYLIFFDPLDVTHYPNLGNPSTPDIVDLADVGSAIPGVVFTGSFGDQVGFAVAGGGRMNIGNGQDIAIGAPGSDPGAPPRIDAGAAYVIFDDASLSGTIALDRVANGQGDQVEGVIFIGGSDGDNVGFSLAFPGDVVGDIGDDLAIGIPGLDPQGPLFAPADVIPNGGGVGIPMGGGMKSGIIETVDIGTGGSPGTQATGTEEEMQLGYSVSGGGDNMVDGEADLLMGAPGYDGQDDEGQPLNDSGLVAQTASQLQQDTTFPVSEIGSEQVNGVLYTGTGDGDQLGATVVGLGDVTGDGFDDVAFGAPFADPLVDAIPVIDGGTVYVVDGLVPADLTLGSIEVDQIGLTVSGNQLVGAEDEEQASTAMAATGDVNGDNNNDYLVGAPGHDALAADDDAGTVYVIVDSAPELPGTCGPEGCVIAHLPTGAQLRVEADSLASTTGLQVLGIVDPGLLPVPPPAGKMLLAAADFDPEAQSFAPPLATIHLPVRPGLVGQFAGGEMPDLSFFSGGAWVAAGVSGTIEANPHYPSLLAVAAGVDALHYYAAFLDDADGDDYWDALDSDSADPFACADTDGDSCDDCSSGTYAPDGDGSDADGDGACDLGDSCTDVDGDGVGNGTLGNAGCLTLTSDSDDGDATACADDDSDGCDDCSSGTYAQADDGLDTDTDGACDLGDLDDDNDGVADDTPDPDPLDPNICADADSDTCDDCAVGTDGFGPLPDNDPANDGLDTDADGSCDLSDDCTDADGDGVGNGNLGNTGCPTSTSDSNDGDATACADDDSDGCDDCSSGTYAQANDGLDTDSDGACNVGDPDDDNDGVADDTPDPDPLDPNTCADADSDTCDDCAVGTDGFGPLPDNDPANDGLDTDGDGACNLGDPDDDDDGFADAADCLPLDAQSWSTPDDVQALTVQYQQTGEITTVSWVAPAAPGTSLPLLYDSVGSSDPADFATATDCVETAGDDTQSTDTDAVAAGTVKYYLARALNACGPGSAGLDELGQPRDVTDCP